MKNSISSSLTFLFCVISVFILLSLSACSMPNAVSTQTNIKKPSNNLGNSEYYTHELANELFAAMLPDRQYRYAVAGFVPIDSLKQMPNSQGPLMLLGHQLEQGLMTEAVKRGYIAQDFKATNSIIISDLNDRVLSRDIDALTQIQRVDYYITGTITAQESGAMVNARVIDARNKDVVAAATQFFPDDLFWTNEQVTIRNGRLYRTQQAQEEVDL